jgi:hypothetical protein
MNCHLILKSTGSFGFVSGFVPVTPIAISDFYGGKIIEITVNHRMTVINSDGCPMIS